MSIYVRKRNDPLLEKFPNFPWPINRKKIFPLTFDVSRMPVNKNDAKKTFVTNPSDNHTSETHTTGVYTPICF